MNRAFTLIELLITIALSAILFLAVTQLYVVYRNIVTVQQATLGVSLGATKVMDAVHAAAAQADAVVSTHTFTSAGMLTSGTTAAIFELPSVDSAGAVVAGSYDYIGIYASGTDAYQVTDAAAGSARVTGSKLLTSLLSSLSFAYGTTTIASATSTIASATTTASVKGTATSMHLEEQTYLHNQ